MPSPSAFSKIMGSLRPSLCMYLNVKSGNKTKKDEKQLSKQHSNQSSNKSLVYTCQKQIFLYHILLLLQPYFEEYMQSNST